MQCVYRGVSYEVTPTSTELDLIDTGLSGKYRGATVQFRSMRNPIIPQSITVMHYRGISHLSWK